MKIGKSKKADPTLENVIEVVRTGFVRVENRLDTVERHLGVVGERLDNVEDSVRQLSKRVYEVENKIEDMQDTLEGVGKAVSTDSLTILNHGRRITRLEKANV